MQALLFKARVHSATAAPAYCVGAHYSPFVVMAQQRDFAARVHRVGPNDKVLEEKRRLRKFGLKRHFYDSIPLITRDLPKEQ